MKKLVAVLAAAIFMAVPALGIAALAGPNTVNSAAIIDGEVKTADIANLAVTTAKIADGAVSAAKLGIVCSTGQILQYTSTGWVCSAGTSGPVGPQGPQGIPGVAGATGATGLQGPAARYANVIVVAKSGGDFTDPITAIASITDASATNPYLVKIMPGVYSIGNNTLFMQPYVDLEGSGENTTLITGNNSSNYNGVVKASSNSEIRFITVENTVNTGVGITVALSADGTAKITNVSANATAGSGDVFGIALMGGAPVLTNVTCVAKATTLNQRTWGLYITGYTIVTVNNSDITAVGANINFGIGCYSYSPGGGSNKFNNVSVKASGGSTLNLGMTTYNSPTEITNSNIYSDTQAVSAYNHDTSMSSTSIKHSNIKGSVDGLGLKISFSQLDGPVGSITCFNNHDAAFAPVNCP